MSKDMLRLGITLFLVCGVAGLGLAVVYDTTKPIIEQRALEDAERAAKSAIPGASEILEETKDGATYYLGRSGGEVVGAAMKVQSLGYNKTTPIEMVVGVDGLGRVTGVSITSIYETPGIGSRVNDGAFLSRFAGASPASVDGIAGATYSSRAVKAGVEKAAEFLGSIVAPKEPPVAIDLASIPDGTYKGTGEGFNGPIEVEVTVAGGKVTAVTVLSHKETPGEADDALKQVPKAIVDRQKVEVDSVAGATYASKGIMGAVRNALASAPTK